MAAFKDRSQRNLWIILGLVAVLAILIVWRAPEEQTIGEGIRTVYVHVALTWAGEAGLIIAGLAGLRAALGGRRVWQVWAHTIGWVALGVLAAGTAVSLLAEIVNWGGIAWLEPRTVAALQLLAVALIVQIVNSWWLPYRVRGLLNAALAIYLVWQIAVTPLVLHPRNPVSASSSLAIQATFYALFALFAIAEAALIWHWRPRP